MTGLIIVLCVLMIGVIIVQVGRVSELAGRIRGNEEIQRDNNNMNGIISLVFMVVFLISTIVSAWYYKNSMLGYGPHESASLHGSTLDYIFNVTLFFTAIVFFITHIALFWFAYKYRGQKGRKAIFLSHDNRLELIWTIIPAVVMTFLVVGGLDAWNEVMADVGEGEEHIEIEATGMQFAWMMRYPGEDGLLGRKDYTLINSTNPLGMDWTDTKNHDDWVSTAAGEILKLPVGKKVRVRITSRDVLHNFDLPHFRVKMDAVPGLPTYFVFTPSMTTEEYRQNLGALKKNGEPKYPEWWEPSDPDEPDGPKRWEAFMFELACAELCGNGHYSMRRVVDIVSQEEFDMWAAGLQGYYDTTIKGTEEDPFNTSGGLSGLN
ncbi:MAG: cytochrome c oxidase subunit II [Eudoraea sp.]|nr:cytochrome c oxidase subunit II [Eudoraea sp.]NNE28049.1 cytochrome c oxidase subunit II [Saprospiraceae bacterium]